MLIVALILASGSAAEFRASLEEGAGVDACREVLSSPASTSDERAAAVARLRTLAAGEPAATGTREAIFTLAEVLDDGGTDPPRNAMDAMVTAAALYPEDPRTPSMLWRLGPSQVRAGDTYSAHVTFTRLLQPGTGEVEPSIAVLAASNAIGVGDTAAAFSWLERVDPGGLEPTQQVEFHLARLKAAQALDRNGQALSAASELETLDPERMRQDAAALLAAARAEEAGGRLESAASRYETFVNVHASSPHRPAAMLALGRSLAKLGRKPAARRSLEWLIAEHPDAPEASLARLDLIEVDPPESIDQRIDAYAGAAGMTQDAPTALEACRRMTETLLDSGHVLEAASTLGRLSRESPHLRALAARQVFKEALPHLLSRLAGDRDEVAIAAIAVEAEATGLTIPGEHAGLVERARASLGLTSSELPSLVEDELDRLRATVLSGDWAAVLAKLEPLARPAPEAVRSNPRVALLWAEALWRNEREEEAVAVLRAALDGNGAIRHRRRLEVLRSDILFASGDRETACAGYRKANAIASTSWVDEQLDRCVSPDKEPRS
jgi:TolA-binding protein